MAIANEILKYIIQMATLNMNEEIKWFKTWIRGKIWISNDFRRGIFYGLENGKAKEYNYSGKVLFEGEYKNGRRWNRKEYNSNCVVIYEVGFSYRGYDGKGK